MEHLKLIILIATFLFPLILSIALFMDSKNDTSRKIMAFALLNTSLIFIFNYLYLQQDYSLYYPLHSYNAAIQYLIFPLIYLYIKSIVFPKVKITSQLLHFLPAALMFLVASYIFYIYTNKNDMIYFLKNNRQGVNFVEYKFFVLKVSRYVHLILIAVQGVLYSMAFFRIPNEYDEKLQNEFSNIDNFSIDWINKYLLSFALIVAGGFLLYAFLPLIGHYFPLIIGIFFIFSAYVCRLGILAMKQQRVEINLDVIDVDMIPQADLTEIKDEVLIRKLTDYMEIKQAFLQPDISLTSVSKDLGTNRTYLSTLINQQYGVNFNTYINQYRVQYANEYIKTNPEVTREQLYQLAGFGSVSTMNRALKST
ncbi:MAG: AraC family transcriptional regulator [Paludibacter sp.]